MDIKAENIKIFNDTLNKIDKDKIALRNARVHARSLLYDVQTLIFVKKHVFGVFFLFFSCICQKKAVIL